MKPISLFIIIIVFLGCTTTRKVTFNSERVYNFKTWKTDSIKTFLSDTWIRIGKFERNEIVEDTLGSFITNKDTITRLKLVNPSGMYHVFHDKKEKQEGIPAIILDFDMGWASIQEDECYLPDFNRCGISFHCFTTSRLIFKNDKPIIEYSGLAISSRVKNPIHYIDENIILIENRVYIRSSNWAEYAANNGYKSAQFVPN